jgi:uncharacterized protein (DUF2132 family)
LLFGALNVKRNIVRKKIVNFFEKVNDTQIFVKGMHEFPSLTSTLEYVRNSKYCMVPAGDAPALTQRFPAAIISGCVPIHVDPYQKHPSVQEHTLPFFRQIDWSDKHISAKPVHLDHMVERIRSKHVDTESLYGLRNSMKYSLKLDNDASQRTVREIKLIVSSFR